MGRLGQQNCRPSGVQRSPGGQLKRDGKLIKGELLGTLFSRLKIVNIFRDRWKDIFYQLPRHLVYVVPVEFFPDSRRDEYDSQVK